MLRMPLKVRHDGTAVSATLEVEAGRSLKSGVPCQPRKMRDAQMTTDNKCGIQKKEIWPGRTVQTMNNHHSNP